MQSRSILASLLLTCPTAAIAADAATSATTRPATALPIVCYDEAWKDAARANRVVPVRVYLPPEASPGPWPIIFVSHGLGDSRRAMAYACEAWAAAGYAVVTLQHAGSDEDVWRNAKAGEGFAAIRAAASIPAFIDRIGDVHFGIDELTRRASSDARLAGRLDFDRIGIAGHSFGALTAQGIIGQRYAAKYDALPPFRDDRVKAAILMSPGVEGVNDIDRAFAEVHVPTLHLTGTLDETPNLSKITAAERRVPFDRMVHSERYLVIFKGGDHVVFSGHGLPGINEKLYARIHRAVVATSRVFWDAELRGDESARIELTRRCREILDSADRFEGKNRTP